MAIQARPKQNQLSTGVTAITGAAPQTINGSTLLMTSIEPGTLSASVYAKATTNTLTITGKWQVSSDGTNFYDCFPSNNAAQVVIVTGTGSAVTSTRRVDAPAAVYGALYARYVLTSGVGSGGGLTSDEGSVAYNYRQLV